MKIIDKKIRECELENSQKELVLDITYTHYWKKGNVLIRHYKKEFETPEFDEYIMKQVKQQVKNNYNLTKTLWQSVKN